ncbi:MAG: gamma-glutamyltransferase [Proteobacteria bacterium]|nr:gamma-glutamyltransferase [Pseudomonadota bacterium]
MTQGMISAPQPEAVEVGIDIMKSGGNIVDATVAAALVQTVVDPQMCGIAGFGNIQLFLPSLGVHTTFDFHGRAPLAVKPNMWENLIEREAEDGWGFILSGRENEIGYGSISTPRTLAALEKILNLYGSMSLGELITPAIKYCEEGVLIRPHMSAFWNEPAAARRDPNIAMVTKYEATRKIYCNPNGKLKSIGEILFNPDLAKTYKKISKNGVQQFYNGSIAQKIVKDMENNGGLISMKDLENCFPEQKTPLWGTYRGHKIATNNPPGGGIMLIEMLNILENFDLKKVGHNSSEYIKIVSEVMKIATIDKDTKVGDPDFFDVPVEELTSKKYAKTWAEKIKNGYKADVHRLNAGATESKNTTQLTLADGKGNCVSMTHTLGQPSGVVTDGLGFMYNGAMTVFDPRPGRSGSLAPGKARFTALSPTIVFKKNKPYLIVGAPGATYITMANLQVILNVCEFGMNAQEAVSAPRFAATSNTIELSNRIFRSTEERVRAAGYPVKRQPHSYTFAWVHAIRINAGKLDGGADPGADGMVASTD